eukprot:1139883-Rhodomonas_salina.2
MSCLRGLCERPRDAVCWNGGGLELLLCSRLGVSALSRSLCSAACSTLSSELTLCRSHVTSARLRLEICTLWCKKLPQAGACALLHAAAPSPTRACVCARAESDPCTFEHRRRTVALTQHTVSESRNTVTVIIVIVTLARRHGPGDSESRQPHGDSPADVPGPGSSSPSRDVAVHRIGPPNHQPG